MAYQDNWSRNKRYTEKSVLKTDNQKQQLVSVAETDRSVR